MLQTFVRPLSRRRFLSGSSAAVAAGAAHLAAPALAQSRTIKIGYVSPQSGPLAPFGEADSFVVGQLRALFAPGLEIGGTVYPVEILVKDSQSTANRAAEVAADLILSDAVDIMLCASTPETTAPVSDQCELNGIPCISSVTPWQAWLFSRGGTMEAGFDWTYHFFFGLDDLIASFVGMWNSFPNNGRVGGLFPNNGDGIAASNEDAGFPAMLRPFGYQVQNPGLYRDLTDDFSAQVQAFKSAEVDIITGVMTPPDMTTFWVQARQAGFRPKAATIGAALVFPSGPEALGDLAHNLSCDVWWAPEFPYVSSLTGQSCSEIAQAWTTETGRQWIQPVGFIHALFEVAVHALRQAGGPGDPSAIRDAIAGTQLQTTAGNLDWTAGPMRNVARLPSIGGQWRRGSGANKFDLVIVNNEQAPDIPKGGDFEVLS
jgi:branched-chain amino acid transport system substrate-binding protein